MMDNSKLYQHRFDELLKLFKRNGDSSYEKLASKEHDMVIDISGNSFREYARLIEQNEAWVIHTIQTLMKGLLDSYGIEYEVPVYEFKKANGRIGKKSPFAFAITKDGKITGYNFRYYSKSGLVAMRKYYRKFKDIDAVRIYQIRKDTTELMKISNDIELKEDNSYLWFGIIKDFFDEFFTDDEYKAFLDYAERFNESARNLIGYKMMAMPTRDAVASFKVKKAEMLHDDFSNYAAIVAKELDKDQFEIIKHNYIDKGRYKLITADSSFADSFVSSEWYYGIHSITGAIDETGVVTGYLKSIEQLLYEVLKLYLGRERKRIGLNAKKKDDFEANYPGENHGGFIDFIEDYEYYFDTTLGSLIKFIKFKNYSGDFFNKDFFDVDHDTIQFLVDTLYEFKDFDRNDHLHKDNLYSLEELKTIRSKAIVLYSLILGSFKIPEYDMEKLGLEEPEVPGEMNYEAFSQLIKSWASPIITYDIPKDANVLAFVPMKFVGYPWRLTLQGLQGIDKDKYDTLDWNRKQVYSTANYNGNLVWESKREYTEVIEQLKRILYSMIDSDDEIGNLLRNYAEIVLGDMEVLEVLYKK